MPSELAYIVDSAYCPSVDNSGIGMPPLPPPPVFYGVELSRPRARIEERSV